MKQPHPQSGKDPKIPPPGRPPGPTPRSPSELLAPTRPPSTPKRIKSEREPRRMNGFLRFVNASLSFAFVALLLTGALAIWLRQSVDKPGPLAQSAAVIVSKGDAGLDIAERLEKAGVIDDRRVFMVHYYTARIQGAATGIDRSSLKAGEYEFAKAASVRQVLDTVISGRGVLHKLTVPEGLTSRQIVDRLKADLGLTGDITEVPPEGSLLPDTYKYSRGASRQEIVDRMRAEHTKLVAALWAGRAPDVPIKTPEEALVLASIVEKETGRADERPKVAAVFVNRIRKGMRLQSDPTIVYGLVGGQGPLGRGITRADIDSKTPYNTYQIDGLPPGPICNPGRAALTATLNPPATQDLFFVADGTGGHAFTSTLKDHNAAVANWRRIEKGRQQGTPGAAAAPEAQAASETKPAPALINASKAGASAPAAAPAAAAAPAKKAKQ